MPWRGYSRKTIGVWLPYDVSVSVFICANILIFNGIAMLLSLNLMGKIPIFIYYVSYVIRMVIKDKSDKLKIDYIRHPSYNGESLCKQQLDDILK